METQNVTLVIPEQILREAKLLAVKRQTSLSVLLTRLLSDMVVEENEYASAQKRHP